MSNSYIHWRCCMWFTGWNWRRIESNGLWVPVYLSTCVSSYLCLPYWNQVYWRKLRDSHIYVDIAMWFIGWLAMVTRVHVAKHMNRLIYLSKVLIWAQALYELWVCNAPFTHLLIMMLYRSFACLRNFLDWLIKVNVPLDRKYVILGKFFPATLFASTETWLVHCVGFAVILKFSSIILATCFCILLYALCLSNCSM